VGAWPASVGGKAVVEGMHGEFDQPVSETPLPRPLVARTGPGTKWSQGHPKCGATDRVEQPTHHQSPVFALAQIETPVVDRRDMLVEHCFCIGGMARVGAVEAEAADRVLQGEFEQGLLVKLRGARTAPH
jgi:hypothetical protein